MSVRHALLALLSEQPKYGLQLRQEFEAKTGEVWPLNVGQVYTTLQRLERDGFVESDGADRDGRENVFRLTVEGRAELLAWLATPDTDATPPRDELVIKVLIALTVPGVDVRDIVQRHRRHLVESMQQFTRLKEDATDNDVGLTLVVDAELFRLEAKIRWLDAAESRITRAGHARTRRDPAGARVQEQQAHRGGCPMTLALELRGVTKIYGTGAAEVHALSDIDLSIAAGELVAIMGPSGSGKSTLLTVAGTLEEPTSGDVSIEGKPVASMSRNDRARLRRHSVGYVFQDFNLLAGLSALENVSLPLELDGMNLKRAQALALDALAEFDMDGRADRFPDALAGGERQRVAIARAVVGERGLLLADEPTGALDSVNGEAVMRMVRRACNRGVAGVIVTHDAQLASWADRIVFLRDGRVVDQTSPRPEADSLLTSNRKP